MHSLKIPLVLLAAVLAGGCSIMQGSKLLVRESFGFAPLAPGLYIEADADEASRSRLREAAERAEDAIRNAYGSVISHPAIHACLKDATKPLVGVAPPRRPMASTSCFPHVA